MQYIEILHELTNFFKSSGAHHIEDSDADKEWEIEFDTFHPAGFIWIHTHSPLMELHLLCLHIDDLSWKQMYMITSHA